MPELPEVETVKRKLEPNILGKTIKYVKVYYPKHKLLEVINNEQVLKLDRYGKYLIIYLTKHIIISHLRMEGKYRILADSKITKHDLVEFVFDDFSLLYNDTRRFGIFYLFDKNADIYRIPPLSKLGKEPFDATEDYLLSKISHRSTAIKTLLLDQSILTGLGNIYADEVLFESKVNPKRHGSSINKDEAKKIIDASRLILQKAIKSGGTTIKSYESLNGEEGHFQIALNVHQKEGSNCPNCGNIIMKIKVNGRGTYFCPSCEPLNKTKVYAITGAYASGKSSVLSYLSSLGFKTISLDDIAKGLYISSKPMQRKILKEFSTLDKKKIASIAASDRIKREKLEAITHPYIINEMNKEIMESKDKIIFVEVPLLFESHLEKAFTKTISVLEGDSIKEKILQAKGITNVSELAKSQLSKEEKARMADYVIYNNDSITKLNENVKAILKEMEVI